MTKQRYDQTDFNDNGDAFGNRKYKIGWIAHSQR